MLICLKNLYLMCTLLPYIFHKVLVKTVYPTPWCHKLVGLWASVPGAGCPKVICIPCSIQDSTITWDTNLDMERISLFEQHVKLEASYFFVYLHMKKALTWASAIASWDIKPCLGDSGEQVEQVEG